MASIPVFFCEPIGQQDRRLRRYASGSGCCGDAKAYHNAEVAIGVVSSEEAEANGDNWPHDDPRWPTKCARCDYVFTDDDEWQLFVNWLYRRSDNGEVARLRDMPVGAVWDATWLHGRAHMCGADGRSLICKTPGGDWMIDSRASNCTLPDDDVHKCWVRHGSPEDGTLHVDKDGLTCAAGAGSIMAGSYHGFLHHGHLTDC